MERGQPPEMAVDPGGESGPGAGISAAGEAAQALTPRQTQILALLQTGRSNKEIAADLGIGLGTVKQHMNVLFKKLDVSNRTMAVSRDRAVAAAPAAPKPLADGVRQATRPELRPATVLSITLPARNLESLAWTTVFSEGAEEDASPLARVLAAVASDFAAVFLPRSSADGYDGGDLLFGVQRCREQDVLRAVRAAFAALRRPELQPAAGFLQAGVESGRIAVGATAKGAWGGEILAGGLLSRAHDLAARAAPHSLSLGAEARALTARLSGQVDTAIPETLDLATGYSFAYSVPPAATGLRGRRHEQAALENAVAQFSHGVGQAVTIEGEAGIGKTALLATLPALCRRSGHPHEIWRCIPPDGQPLQPARGHLMNVETGAMVSGAALADRLAGPEAEAPRAIGLDDLHWLPPETLRRLFDAIAVAAGQGRLVVTTARPVVRAAVGAVPGAQPMRLGRLDGPALEALCNDAALKPPRPEALASLCERAGGVPLFALETLRALSESGRLASAPPLTLLTLLVARLDGFQLDRRLLRMLAERPGARRIDSLRQSWDGAPEDFDAALAAAEATGVLRRSEHPEPSVAIGHPMIQATLNHVLTEWDAVGGPA